MSKKDSLCQNGDKRINPYFMPEWNDDNMSNISDNNPTEKDKSICPDDTPFDANYIDDYENLRGVPVMDRFGRIIGERMEPSRKKRPKKK